MKRIVVEADAVLRTVPVLLDPETPEEHRRAIADYFIHDVPDFADWCRRLHQQLPGLYPAKVISVKDQDELRAEIADADAVIVESLAIGEAELAAAPRLAIVQKFGSIVGNIDLDACARRRIPVEIQRRRVNVAVAEQILALMLALAKRLCELQGVVTAERLTAAGFTLKPYDRRYSGNSNYARITGLRTLNGATLGIIGLGEIGREVASRGAAFGMDVLYHQRNRIGAAEEWLLHAHYAGLEELLETSDYVVVQVPLNDTTRGLIGRSALQRIKPGAFLVDAARAEIIDRAALLEALDSGRLGGLGLDVLYEEPARPDDALLDRPNVVLMPHTAIAERQNGLLDMEEMCLKLWRATTMRHA